jgi:hypothetical protein
VDRSAQSGSSAISLGLVVYTHHACVGKGRSDGDYHQERLD